MPFIPSQLESLVKDSIRSKKYEQMLADTRARRRRRKNRRRNQFIDEEAVEMPDSVVKVPKKKAKLESKAK
jgi:hypothetical protein